jgi:hypothetical protein
MRKKGMPQMKAIAVNNIHQRFVTSRSSARRLLKAISIPHRVEQSD